MVAEQSQPDPSRFLARSDLVLVPVTVTTGRGRAVPGLKKEHFSIFDDHMPQVITHFTSEDAPASIGLVIDCSDSMQTRLGKAQEAIYAVLQSANPGDEFFLIRFSDKPELKVGSTSQTEEIRRSVRALRANGSTALLDAVNTAWLEMRKTRYARRAIILISDGEDNASHITPDEFNQLAAENDTTIYTLFIGALPDIPEQWSKATGLKLLADIARQTGGEMFPVSKVKELPNISRNISSWVRSQYVLGYVPGNHSRNCGYHRIRVKVSKPDGFPKLHPTWRLVYYVPDT
jgi:Ca-activated chloride channel family protein